MSQTDSSESMILSSRRVVTPNGERPATVVISKGRIDAIDDYEPSRGRDLGDLALLPGLIDGHVHLNEPGRAEWEGIETGTLAAAAGGVTTLVDMPLNSTPVTTTVAALSKKREAAGGKLSVDVGFHGGLVAGSAGELPALLAAGVLGIKAFLCDSGLDEFPAVTRADLEEAMPLIASHDSLLLVHAELTHDVPAMRNPRPYQDYLATRPATFERDAIEMLIELCERTGCRTHIVHLSAADCLESIADAKNRGLPLTVETCPHYLIFAAEEIGDGQTALKCAPPIRDAGNRERLWQGLKDGVIDLVASDHSPCPPDMKHLDSGRFDLAWGGISSLQLTLSVLWTEASRRGLTLSQVVNWTSHAPGRVFGIEAGIKVDSPANLVVFDPHHEWRVEPDQLLHRHKVTPYAGHELRGRVVETWLRGKKPAAGQGRLL
jgi:allantoinase